jgi:hypothetical protein
VLAMLKPSTQEKLGNLLRMLSLDKDGEVLAATTAVKRTLATEGLDIHSLGDAVCHPAPRAKAKAQSRARAATGRLMIILNKAHHG